MDSSDGCREPIKTTPVVFTVPYSDFEILLLTDPSGTRLGIVYHPMKMDDPITWHSQCPHCLRGKQSDLDIAVKRAIQVLVSRKITGDTEEYLVPTNGQCCSVSVKRIDKGMKLKILTDGQESIDATWDRGKLKSDHKHLLLRSKILDRSMRLIASSKEPNMRSIKSSLMPMLIKQRREGIAIHRRFPCFKIDWASIVIAMC
jgi:hypothetical protein